MACFNALSAACLNLACQQQQGIKDEAGDVNTGPCLLLAMQLLQKVLPKYAWKIVRLNRHTEQALPPCLWNAGTGAVFFLHSILSLTLGAFSLLDL